MRIDPTSPLIRAYLATTYCVDAPEGTIALRIGQSSARLDQLLRRHGVRAWAFITACNPSSRALPRWRNALRQRRLRALLARRGGLVWQGAGVGDDALWPPEPSFLVADIAPAAARRIGRQFGQHAIVAGRRGRVVDLVWCRAGAAD